MLRILLLLLLLSPFPVWAQNSPRPVPKGQFGKDSVKIGEMVTYALSYRYPSDWEVVFPDSSFDFSPFEFVGKTFYPTRSRSGQSLDSTVYLLRTFGIEPVQRLAVAVSVLSAGDTLQVPAPADSVVLQQLVREVPDPLVLLTDTTLLPIEKQFNYPYLLVGLGAGLVLLLLIWQIFGVSIRTNYKLYKLRNDHSQFISRYKAQAERFRRSESSPHMEKAVSLWKNYLTKLEEREINSFTTKEISEYYEENEDVNTALKLCDKAIYGNIVAEDTSEWNRALLLLQTFAILRYNLFREKTRNAADPRRNV